MHVVLLVSVTCRLLELFLLKHKNIKLKEYLTEDEAS